MLRRNIGAPLPSLPRLRGREGRGCAGNQTGRIMLKGRNAVVTGSTSGIGLAIARALAQDGANVMINGFGTPAELEKERTGIEKEFGVKAIYSPADMTKPAEIAAMIKTAETTLGSVDI